MPHVFDVAAQMPVHRESEFPVIKHFIRHLQRHGFVCIGKRRCREILRGDVNKTDDDESQKGEVEIVFYDAVLKKRLRRGDCPVNSSCVVVMPETSDCIVIEACYFRSAPTCASRVSLRTRLAADIRPSSI